MSNVVRMDHPDSVQRAQGEHLWSMLEAERWTYRKLQARTGMKVGVISSRMRGVTPLTIGEVATFAGVLQCDPVALYRELLECAPSDSNREPIDYGKSRTMRPVIRLRPRNRVDGNGPKGRAV